MDLRNPNLSELLENTESEMSAKISLTGNDTKCCVIYTSDCHFSRDGFSISITQS